MLLTDANGAWHPSLTGSGSSLQLSLALPPPQSNSLDHGDRIEIPATPYSCQFCERNFPRLSLLKKHEQTHSDQLPFKCEYCQRLFKHKRSRDRHVKLHTGDKKYKCDQCEAAFSRSDHLKIHVKTHDSRKPFQCSLCQRGYNTGAALTSHMLNHRRESGSVSSTSSAATSLTSSRISQSPVTSGSPATPPQSPVATNDERRRETGSSAGSNEERETRREVTTSPIVTVKSERPPTPANSSHDEIEPRLPASPETLKCQYCGIDSFSSLEALGSHVQALHGPSCSALRPSSSTREQSPNVKLEDRSEPLPQARQLEFQLPFVPHLFICHLCNGRFTSLPALHQHTLSSHNLTDVLRLYYPSMVRYPNMEAPASDSSNKDAENGLLLTCPQCPMSFHDVESYSIHLKTHWETALRMTQGLFPPRVSCPDCGLDMTRFDPSQVDAHAASHILATSVEYGCQACMKTFTKPDELQKHLLDIHAHHLYKCSLCKEVFDSKVSIQVHFAVKHSDECKMYRCTLCSTVCKSDSEFTAHVKNAHAPVLPMAPFRCKVCSEGFSVEFLLERHLQTEHGIFPGYQYFNVVNDIKCEFCSEQFPSTSVLLLHMQSAHSDDSHSCSVCGEVLRSRGELDAHLKTHQPSASSGARLKCNICDDFFGSHLELAEHKLRHYKVQGPPQCSNCKVVITSVEEYKAHTIMHSNQMPFLCIVCRQSINSDSELELHAQFHSQRAEERKAFQCTHCPSSYITETDLREHIISHTVIGQTIECKLCRQNFDTPLQLQLHLIEHTHAGLSSYPCTICNAVFTQAVSLQRHTAEHSLDSRPYSCNDCGLKFFFSSELDHHSVLHQQRSPREFKCDDCSQTFPSLSMLSHHRIIHDNVSSPVKCPECPATFSEGSSMIMHFRAVHEIQQSSPEVKEFKCEQCGLEFPCLSNLQGHVKLHTMETCFRCDICSKDFALQRNLQIHLRSHNGERPYGCRICDKRFARKENRKAHEKSHTGVKPFTCTVCARAFTRKCHLREHRKLHEKTSQSIEEINYSSDGSDEEVNVDEL